MSLNYSTELRHTLYAEKNGVGKDLERWERKE